MKPLTDGELTYLANAMADIVRLLADQYRGQTITKRDALIAVRNELSRQRLDVPPNYVRTAAHYLVDRITARRYH